MATTASDDLDRWRRWVDHGGAYEVVVRAEDRVTLSLLTCTGGEEMDRITSSDPALLDALAADNVAGADDEA